MSTAPTQTSHLDSIQQAPLKVMLVLDTRAWAGTESHVRTLALGLRDLAAESSESAGTKRQVEVTIAAPRKSPLWDRARTASLPLVAIARHHEWSWDTLQTLTRRLRRGATDVIHVHNGRTALFGALAVRLAGRGACVFTHHFIAPAHAQDTGLVGYIKTLIHHRLADGITHHIAISHAVGDALQARGEVEPERMSVVYNGIEAPQTLQQPSEGLPPSLQGEIACIARLEKEKDIPTLVHAMKILHAQRSDDSDVRCIIAGEGSEYDNLKTLIQSEGLCDTVHLAGFTPLAGAIMRASRVCVLPSVAEPFGLAIVEAMAQERAVVAVDAGGPREIVVEGETGHLVSPSDATAMAHALNQLLEDPEKARAMGQAGFKRYETQFTSRRMAQETLSVYRRALESTRNN